MEALLFSDLHTALSQRLLFLEVLPMEATLEASCFSNLNHECEWHQAAAAAWKSNRFEFYSACKTTKAKAHAGQVQLWSE